MMQENPNPSTRLTELEVKLAYAEDLLDSLNRTVFRQQAQIDLLQREVQHIYRQLKAVASPADGEPRDLRDEIPPHY